MILQEVYFQNESISLLIYLKETNREIGQTMDIELIRSKRRTIVIEITTDCRVVVKAPYGASKAVIDRFIGEKADWISKHLKKMRERQQEEAESKPISEQEMRLLVTRAKRIIPVKVRKFAELIGVTYGRITIRNQKTRWGSCSAEGNLNFNCVLMRAPEEIVDYVVVHELCHRIHMDHSAEFWKEVGSVIPDYKDRRKWLRDNEKELMRG